MTSPERTAVKLTREKIEQAADELRWYAKHLDNFHEEPREKWKERFNREIDELRDMALASLSERQDGQIGHSAPASADADRRDAMPEEPGDILLEYNPVGYDRKAPWHEVTPPQVIDYIVALRAYAERAREDAERYRWLRDNCSNVEDNEGGRWEVVFSGYLPADPPSVSPLTDSEQVDAAIDAALAVRNDHE